MAEDTPMAKAKYALVFIDGDGRVTIQRGKAGDVLVVVNTNVPVLVLDRTTSEMRRKLKAWHYRDAYGFGRTRTKGR